MASGNVSSTTSSTSPSFSAVSAPWTLPSNSPAPLAARRCRVRILVGKHAAKPPGVLAVDRAAHCLLYGDGLAHRLGMTGRLCFACASADEALHWVRECYAGPLRAVLFMFPTPPALDERSKNAQLPQTPSKCLVNAATLRLAARAGSEETCVLVASNVEDVAVDGGVLLPLDAAMAWTGIFTRFDRRRSARATFS